MSKLVTEGICPVCGKQVEYSNSGENHASSMYSRPFICKCGVKGTFWRCGLDLSVETDFKSAAGLRRFLKKKMKELGGLVPFRDWLTQFYDEGCEFLVKGESYDYWDSYEAVEGLI